MHCPLVHFLQASFKCAFMLLMNERLLTRVKKALMDFHSCLLAIQEYCPELPSSCVLQHSPESPLFNSREAEMLHKDTFRKALRRIQMHSHSQSN